MRFSVRNCCIVIGIFSRNTLALNRLSDRFLVLFSHIQSQQTFFEHWFLVSPPQNVVLDQVVLLPDRAQRLC